jgi:quinol monooxygenase YgiN
MMAPKTPLLALVLCFSLLSRPSEGFSESMSGKFALNVAFKVKPDRRDEFLRVMRSNIKQTMTTEPNALQFLLGQDLDDRNVFFLHEEYKAMSDHREAHSKTKHYEECTKFFATEPFAEPHVCDEFVLAHDGPTDKIPNSEAFCLNVELNIHPDRRKEFLEVIENNKKGSDQEPLCLQ